VPAPILIIEDDATTAETLRLYLEREGFTVSHAADGETGLERAEEEEPVLVILDLMLPRLSGTQVCRALRRRSNVPILMLTARTTEDDRIEGLEVGADDYVPKPFSPREVVARVKAILRRTEFPELGGRERLYFQGMEIDLARREVVVDGIVAPLTPTEFRLLVTLARTPGRVYSRQDLAERAIGEEFDGLDRTVDAHIMNLRRKIEPDRSRPTFVVTVFGEGYRFAGERA